MCIDCSALFRCNLKDVRVCFSASVYTKKNCWNLDVQTRFQLFSIQSLQEGVLEFQVLTNDSRMLKVRTSNLFCCCLLVSILSFLLLYVCFA